MSVVAIRAVWYSGQCVVFSVVERMLGRGIRDFEKLLSRRVVLVSGV